MLGRRVSGCPSLLESLLPFTDAGIRPVAKLADAARLIRVQVGPDAASAGVERLRFGFPTFAAQQLGVAFEGFNEERVIETQ